MRGFLKGIRRLFDPEIERSEWKIIPHQGKNHLLDDLPRTFQTQAGLGGDRKIVVLCDQDSDDCRELKRKIRDKVPAKLRDRTLIRVVCCELEAWYLGDKDALIAAYPDCGRIGSGDWSKNPDGFRRPSSKIKEKARGFDKVVAGEKVSGKIRNLKDNRSPSFRVFVSGLRGLCQ